MLPFGPLKSVVIVGEGVTQSDSGCCFHLERKSLCSSPLQRNRASNEIQVNSRRAFAKATENCVFVLCIIAGTLDSKMNTQAVVPINPFCKTNL